MQLRWKVTYDIVTPESAECGETEERGFLHPVANIPFSIEECKSDDDFTRTGTLGELVRECENLGVTFNHDCDWLYCVDGSTNYRTGAVTTYAVHLVGEAEQRNIARIGRLIERKRPFCERAYTADCQE
jgi:hypothetical protein